MPFYDETDGEDPTPGDDPGDLHRRMADEAERIGRKVGAEFGFDPPGLIIADTYIACLNNLKHFVEGRSLSAWVYGHARKVALHTKCRDIGYGSKFRSGSQGLLDGQADQRLGLLAEFLRDNGPASLFDASLGELRQMLDEQRPAWQSRRDTSWAEAQLDAARGAFRRVESRVNRTGLYDALLDEPSERLLAPWMVMLLGFTPDEVERMGGPTVGAIHQATSRLRKKVRARAAARRLALGL